jgi:hypothetical protein
VHGRSVGNLEESSRESPIPTSPDVPGSNRRIGSTVVMVLGAPAFQGRPSPSSDAPLLRDAMVEKQKIRTVPAGSLFIGTRLPQGCLGLASEAEGQEQQRENLQYGGQLPLSPVPACNVSTPTANEPSAQATEGAAHPVPEEAEPEEPEAGEEVGASLTTTLASLSESEMAKWLKHSTEVRHRHTVD